MHRTRLPNEELKAAVGCAVVLEQAVPPWRVDARESSRNALKYRRGKGEIIIVNHAGRGWWDPGHATAKGDVLDLVRYLQPGLSFHEARRLLLRLAGIEPSFPALVRQPRQHRVLPPLGQRWSARRALSNGSATWRYLTRERALPPAILEAAKEADAVREGPHGSAWFAHRDALGRLTGIEMRGPHYRGFSAQNSKSLFQLPGGSRTTRMALCEGSIDALSLAALEGPHRDTLYLASGGGMGPGTVKALAALLGELAGGPGSVLVAATDADDPGQHYVARLRMIAGNAGIRLERLWPGGRHKDWNEALKAGCRAWRSGGPGPGEEGRQGR
jgi:hypothetical protein